MKFVQINISRFISPNQYFFMPQSDYPQSDYLKSIIAISLLLFIGLLLIAGVFLHYLKI